MNEQPNITVGVCENDEAIAGSFYGSFHVAGGKPLNGPFRAIAGGDVVMLLDGSGREILRHPSIHCIPSEGATFSLESVSIGRNFHWERRRTERFEGALTFIAGRGGGVTAVNTLPIESYLASVISSEMSGTAPGEFLKAQAIVSRSWLAAMLLRKARPSVTPPASVRHIQGEEEIIRWYDRQDHEQFDVCADDHCQRYQGISLRGRAAEAVRETSGIFLTWRGEVCDARFHKACGGLTERFGTAWEDIDVPYLVSVSDGPDIFDTADTEQKARLWLLSRPDVYCATEDSDFLARILPDYDRETADFFRWRLVYSRRDLERIIEDKSQREIGTLYEILPLARGPSGRIHRLRIVGSRRTLEIGKELEIRRVLSQSHLYSSAFTVQAEGGTSDVPERFVFHGGGWGHGVGLCQIGAAVMAQRGFSTEAILAHYFPGTSLERRYR
ncbi:MAG: SpoIID/LytB domain-containing protein [Deltaproteobacteria bacterium]|nr:SpoIID/LytB domain-containing protein [Deltaproteobacteria bacterium]